jgi:hypothetical protein
MPEQGLKELGSNPCRNSAEDAALAILGRALTSWFSALYLSSSRSQGSFDDLNFITHGTQLTSVSGGSARNVGRRTPQASKHESSS